MKTRATFYMYRRNPSDYVQFSSSLKGFGKDTGFHTEARSDLCIEAIDYILGFRPPVKKLFKATLLIKQIGQRGLRK